MTPHLWVVWTTAMVAAYFIGLGRGYANATKLVKTAFGSAEHPRHSDAGATERP